ncbi:MAG: pyridine nucleotide-disulfide oxidoreductase [Firmicutes bacterium HGW-Firmicutes-16]|nr:MAG: pyridine nucleotide-disulfide oxidoreductase [Firmicutes bacterium HGW-Firmicutes-16]
MTDFDVIVIGAGPAGLAASLAAEKKGKRVLLVERAARMGGILNQCIHDGFGLIRFGEKLSGCEYANRYINEVRASKVEVSLLTFVTRIEKKDDIFHITLVSRSGIRIVTSTALVLSTGCRERTAKQVSIQGTRPAGVFTAGSAQYYLNILGEMPAKKCVILGSGDIGLIMARRLTLEGAEVIGVYEVKPTPSGLTRNIAQCLDDFDVPLHVSHTVTRLYGESRLTAVEIAQVDEKMRPIAGTEQIVECDTLILSVGLIPENELAETLDIELDPKTKGPVCDQNYETSQVGVFVCGNALHVNDLVDYVSESGDVAGSAAADYCGRKRELVDIIAGKDFAYAVPEKLDVNSEASKTVVFFRSRDVRDKTEVDVLVNGESVYKRKFMKLKPPEMERIVVDFSRVKVGDRISLEMWEA